LIQKGHFDDVDLAAIIHTHRSPELKKAAVVKSCNGCIVKLIRYKGLAAHSGSWPHKAINALNAAHVAPAAIDAQRETFKDEDAIRVRPIITRGGDLVNLVPADVRIETVVRGKTNEAIMDANKKVDLLYGNAEKAKEIKAQHKPILSKEEYLSYQNRIFQKEIFDGETGTSTKLNV